MKDICCIGHITHDRIVTPSHSVDMAGGTSFYFSYGINHLPQEVSYQLVTKIGPDSEAEVERMRKAGIDVKQFNCPHSVFFENRYGIDSNNRTQRVLAKAEPFLLDEMKQVDDARVYHLGSLLADDFPPEAVEYLSTRGKVSIDVQGYLREVRNEQVFAVDWKDKQRILACTHCLKLNEYEMKVITHSSNPRTVALTLADMGVKEVIITLGSYGSLIYAEGQFYEIPAYKPTEVVDATGCGDTYSAGYLYMRLQGAGYVEAGKFAAAMCTLKLQHSGPFTDSITDIRRLIRNNAK